MSCAPSGRTDLEAQSAIRFSIRATNHEVPRSTFAVTRSTVTPWRACATMAPGQAA